MMSMDESLASRLKLYIDSLGITTSQFADMCGIPRPSLSQLLTGRNKKVSNTIIEQIHRAYPDLSVVWLMFGEGPVRVSQSENVTPKSGENAEIPAIRQASTEYPKESGLKNTNFDRNQSENQIFESDLKILDLQRQIENMRKNPRKVIQITVYYDDSTFETFHPA